MEIVKSLCALIYNIPVEPARKSFGRPPPADRVQRRLIFCIFDTPNTMRENQPLGVREKSVTGDVAKAQVVAPRGNATIGVLLADAALDVWCIQSAGCEISR